MRITELFTAQSIALDEAQQAAKALLADDPGLTQPAHGPLRRRIGQLLELKDGTLN